MENQSRPQRVEIVSRHKFDGIEEDMMQLMLSGVVTQKGLSEETEESIYLVKYHLSNMYRHVGVNSMKHLILWAYQQGYAVRHKIK